MCAPYLLHMAISRYSNFTITDVIFGGALLSFSLARLEFLDLNGHLCPPVPSELGATALPDLCYWVTHVSRYRVGIMLHICCILPASILAVFQFLPVIRHKFRLYHRMAGYCIILLVLVSNAGYVIIAPIAMGGDLPTQTFLGFLAIITTTTLGLALYNIRRLQIDQHRAWMLRTWFYIGFVLTHRLLQVIMPLVITNWPQTGRQGIMSCDELDYIYEYNTTKLFTSYPACRPENAAFAPHGNVIVNAALGDDRGRDAVAFEVTFAAAGFLALVLHAVGVEIYLKLTPREAERLRMISYRRQVDKGWRHPGSEGLVVERFGDADPWVPKQTSEISSDGSS